MAEDYNAREARLKKEHAQFAVKSHPLSGLSRDVMRRGFKELETLVKAFLEPLQAGDSIKASSAFEALMRKSHSLQSGTEASFKLKKDTSAHGYFGCLSWQMSAALNNVIQSLYMVGSAMRENQNTVIGKPQIDDKEQVKSVVELMNRMTGLLDYALETDTIAWTRVQSEWQEESSKASNKD